MQKFDRSSLTELQAYLYNDYSHDALLESVRYERKAACLEVEIFHPFYQKPGKFTFCDVELLFAKQGHAFGSRDVILSLTVEEDFSYLDTCIKPGTGKVDDCLYMVFQMFSGDELHIVSRSVTANI